MADDGRVATDETKNHSMPSASRVNFNIPLYTRPAAQVDVVMVPNHSLIEWYCETCNTIHLPPKTSSLSCKTQGCHGVLRTSTRKERELEREVARLRALLGAKG